MSQQGHSLLILSVAAAGVIARRRFVGFDGLQATVQGQKVLGVASMDAAAAGPQISVSVQGTAVVESGAALNPGDRVISDAQGRAIVTTGLLAIKAGAVAVTSTAANGAADLQGSDPPEFIAGTVLPGQVAAGAGAFIEILLGR